MIHDFDNSVFNAATGKIEEYRYLIKGPDK